MKKKLTLSKTRRANFEAAAAMAKLSDFPRVKVGAIAVYKHHIISSGHNTKKTAPIQKKYNQYRFSDDTPHCVHAEVACLKPLIGRNDIDFKHVDLYIYRSGKKDTLLLARPCLSCMQLIKDLGIRSIYYTNENGYSHETILN